MIRLCTGAAAALLLSGCAAAPIQYLTLVPPAGQTAISSGGAAGAPAVSVTVPSQVDQPELIVRLADEIRIALSLSLARQWEPGPAGTVRVQVDVQRFDSVPGQYALIDAVWTLTAGGSAPQQVSCRSSIRIPVGNGYPALAKGHQAAIEQLASQIAKQAVKLGAADTACGAP